MQPVLVPLYSVDGLLSDECLMYLPLPRAILCRERTYVWNSAVQKYELSSLPISPSVLMGPQHHPSSAEDKLTELIANRQTILELRQAGYDAVDKETKGSESEETLRNYRILVLEANDELLQAEVTLAQGRG